MRWGRHDGTMNTRLPPGLAQWLGRLRFIICHDSRYFFTVIDVICTSSWALYTHTQWMQEARRWAVSQGKVTSLAHAKDFSDNFPASSVSAFVEFAGPAALSHCTVLRYFRVRKCKKNIMGMQ